MSLIQRFEFPRDMPLKRWLEYISFGDDINKKIIADSEILLIRSRNKISIEIDLKDR